MSITVTEYINVQERAQGLGLKEPTGLVFLPRNFTEVATSAAFEYEGSLPDVTTLLREAAIEPTTLEPADAKLRLHEQKSSEWLIPTLFIAGSGLIGIAGRKLAADHPDVLSAIFAKVKEYSKIVFTAVTNRTRIKWSIVIEDREANKTQKISFDGPAEELPKLQEFLENTLRNNATGNLRIECDSTTPRIEQS